jgi:hypothetical protein
MYPSDVPLSEATADLDAPPVPGPSTLTAQPLPSASVPPLKRSRGISTGEAGSTSAKKIKTKGLNVTTLKQHFPQLYVIVLWAKAAYRRRLLISSPYPDDHVDKITMAGACYDLALTSNPTITEIYDDPPSRDAILALVSLLCRYISQLMV